jgi:WD40 repeat protein
MDLSPQGVLRPGHKNKVDSIAFHPEGSLLASASSDRTVRIWDGRTFRPLGEMGGFAHRPSQVVFSANGKLLATASGDEKCVRLWDVARRCEARPPLSCRGNVHGVAFSPDSELLAATPQHDGGVVVWDLVAGKRVDLPPGQADYGWAVAFAPDGRSLAAGDYHALKVWRVER